MNSSVKLLLAASAAATVSVPAYAANFVLSPTATGAGSYTFDISDAAAAKGQATDTFTFTIPGSTNGTISIALINTGTGANNVKFVVPVYVAGTPTPVDLGITTIGAMSTAFTNSDISVLAGNTYVLTVTYIAGGAGALFNGNVSFTAAAAAPEPAAWALMILGFGVIGAALRRRNARSSYNVAVSYS